MDEYTPISDFYDGSTILITGGTGFVGKVLTEKLLRCFNVRKIYMLIRPKGNLNASERLRSYFQESIFDKIRETDPSRFEKVSGIDVDFNADKLGLSTENIDDLTMEVNIIFNAVASVKFNEEIKAAININVLGTKKVIDLATNMENLKSFVHISTFFSNSNRKVFSEKVYEQEIEFEKMLQINETLDTDTLAILQPSLLGTLPNTYTMSKNCAENLVNSLARSFATGIFRLPIVLPTYKEPIPGWTDNLYGPTGLCIAMAKGIVHATLGQEHNKSNLIPVDYCVNALHRKNEN